MNALENLEKAVPILHELDEPLLYVGGAVAPLYYERSDFREHARPTLDVDCVAEVVSYLALQPLQEKMRGLGFSEGREPSDPICRWRGRDLVVDLVPVDPKVLGFSNPWYASGWNERVHVRFADHEIAILPYGHFLATKLTAYDQRAVDPRTSHDLEDVLLTLAARSSLDADLDAFSDEVWEYLRKQLGSIFRGPHHRDLFYAYLPDEMMEAENRIRRFVTALEA